MGLFVRMGYNVKCSATPFQGSAGRLSNHHLERNQTMATTVEYRGQHIISPQHIAAVRRPLNAGKARHSTTDTEQEVKIVCCPRNWLAESNH